MPMTPVVPGTGLCSGLSDVTQGRGDTTRLASDDHAGYEDLQET